MTPPWPAAAERDNLDWTTIYPRPEPDQGHGSLLVRRRRQWDQSEKKRLANLRAVEQRAALIAARYGAKRTRRRPPPVGAEEPREEPSEGDR